MINIQKIAEKLKNDRKMTVMLILGVIGVILILISEFIAEKPKNTDNEQVQSSFFDYESDIENRLCDIISQINGAGRVNVMVTLKSGEEKKYAYNEVFQAKNDENSSDSKTENEYVVIDGEKGDECVLLKTEFPEIQGVIVVCDGGDNSVIKNDITNAVSALLNISTNNISVIKMKISEE